MTRKKTTHPPMRVSARGRTNEGRPTTYDEGLATELLNWMAEGKTVRSWCKANGVGQTTVAQWRRAHKEFAKLYAQAREDQGDAIADMAVDDSMDMNVPSDQKRIIVDTRKWFASKMRPKIYGDKVTSEVTGPDGAPLSTQLDADGVIDSLIALATEHPVAAEPLRRLLQKALDAIPGPR